MKKIGIFTNELKDENFLFTKEIIKWLYNKNCEVFFNKEFNDIKFFYKVSDIKEICQNSDFIIILGGDGTVLKLIQYIANFDCAIFGINLGTLGYLTDIEKNDTFISLDKILNNNFNIEKKMLLNIHLNNYNYFALNEAGVFRDSDSTVIKLNVQVNLENFDTYKADGVIISTPIGSTAYNLSAGGPILSPDSSCLSITPICAHKFGVRPLIISNKEIVTIKFEDSYTEKALLVIDGNKKILLHKNDCITIKKHNKYIKMIKTNDLSFYDLLRKKQIIY